MRSGGNIQLNEIGNYYKKGQNAGLYHQLNMSANPSVYTANNRLTGILEDNADNNWLIWQDWNSGSPNGSQASTNYQTSLMHNLLNYNIDLPNGDESYEDLVTQKNVGVNAFLNNSGSTVLGLDTFDNTAIDNIISNQYNVWNSANDYSSLQEKTDYYQNLITGVILNEHSQITHTGSVPNSWILAQGLVVGTFNPLGNDLSSDYTNIEVYSFNVDIDVVTIAAASVAVTPSTYDLQVEPAIDYDSSIDLVATIYPDNATNQNGVWSSSDDGIATVDSNGIVTAVSEGSVIITFTTSDGGFTDTSEITVFREALIASAGNDQVICEGETVTLTASGGPNYLWDNGETTASIEVLPTETTTYSVTVFDDEGNTDEDSVIVTVNAFPIANAGEDQNICQGESIVLNATGGTTYLWSTGETTESIEVNPELETTYEVEVISNDCSSTDSVTVFVTNAPDITISEDVVIVEGESTMLIASGSDDYEWSTGETTESITVNPMVTTTYSVSSIGVNGCSSSLDVIVTVIPEVIADAGDDVTICNGDSITLNASGGGTYIWDTGDSSSSVIVNPETTTTYTVTVEDDYGYTDTDSITIIVNELPDIVADDDVFVMIGNSVTISAAGGDNYSWNTGETTASITVSPETTTTYSVTGFSSNGCQSTVDVLVTVVEELNANAGEDVSICIGSSVTLGASGGVTYTWNTGDTGSSPTFTPDVTTTYSVTVTDGFGNSDTDDVTITVDSMPTAYAGEDQTVCEGDSVILNAGGGTSYLWSTGDTTASINVNPISNTTYTVEVFNNTCSDSDDVTINVMSTPDLIISDDAVVMIGNSTTIDVSGADSYLWNTGETSNSLIVTPEETITYTVTGFGVNGCQNTAQVTVTVVAQVVANAGNDITICEGDSVVLNATGGVTYSWNNGIAGASLVASPNITTTYTVTVTDAYGNSDSDSIVVTVNETPNVTVSESITIIEGESTVLNAYGAEAYIWSTGDTSNSIIINPVQTTTYSVVGTTNSCSAEVFVTVYVEELFVASAGVDIQVCDNQSYQIVLTANQGDSYLWNTGETTQSIVVSPLSTTEYVVTITNGVQEDTDEVIVFVNPSPTVEIANGESVEILNGDFITLSASGANTYEWNNGATQPNIAVSPSATTIYEVRGFVGDCYDEKQVTVNVLQPVEADAGEDVIICLDEIATLTATGGDDYVWSTGETTQTIQVSPTETTDYTVTVFNALDFDEASVRVEVDLNCQIETVVPPIDEILDFSFDIFPNPAVNSVNVKLSGTTIGSDVFIFDLTGKIVKHTEIYNEELSPVTTAQIDISTLQSGVYFVKLIDEDRDITKKLIVR
jgi:hypothetical protein